jgi:hypothetical protein
MVKSIKRKEIGLIPFYTQYEKVQQAVHHSSQYFFKYHIADMLCCNNYITVSL